MTQTVHLDQYGAPAARQWTQRETVIIAALGIVFGMLYLGWVQLWLLLQAAIGPLALDLMLGFWCVVSVLAAYIIRKPLVAFSAEVIAAVAEVMTGNPAGLILVLTGVVQGAGAELPFALTRWRNYRLPVLLASGASAAVFSFAYTWIRFNYGTLAPGLLVAMFALRVTSGILLAGLLGKILGDALYRTGVLSGLAIDAAKRGAA
jgi:energy-coupling factor transport system substrate-specific component